MTMTVLPYTALMLGRIDTDVGYWHAIIWAISFIVLGILAYVLRNLGSKSYKMGTEQVKPYLSGTTEYDKTRVAGENVYWGFVQALKKYYTRIVPVHSGIVSEYIYWLVVVIALLFVIITLATRLGMMV